MKTRLNVAAPARPELVFLSVLAGLAVAGCSSSYTSSRMGAQSANAPDAKGMPRQVQQTSLDAPYTGYIEAHETVKSPLAPLGGTTTVTLRQTSGDVEVALPDYRQLDPDVFGVPEQPRALAGMPVAEGVPQQIRESANGHYTQLDKRTPFGPAHLAMSHGTLKATLVDATATDAAQSRDSVRFDATWQDKDGNTYEVRCDQVYPHGQTEGHPTFGGVLLNHLMHGSSRVGTPLMPTLFSYAAFWGPGEVLKNGKVLDRDRLVHGMLTEYVRGEDYRLDFDKEVTPTRLVLHLTVPPMKNGKPDPLDTGFTQANGKELPFWHVMFTDFNTDATHQRMTASFPAPSQQQARK